MPIWYKLCNNLSLVRQVLCFLCSLDAAEPLIRARIIQQNTAYFHLASGFAKKYARGPFHISYPPEIDLSILPPSIVDIPLITNTIAVIWLSGNEYTIEEMDEDLYYSLIKIKAFFKRFFYNTTWDGELRPARLIKNQLPNVSYSSASLFTGGLDSTTTVLRHFEENPTLISFNSPHVTAVEFANRHKLDFHTIYMNYESFLKLTYLDRVSCDISKWFWDTSMGLSWVGAATPFLYAKNIPVLYIPSGFTWQSFLFPDGQTLTQPASPLIDENLSPAGLRVKHDVFTMTRTDKIQFISTFCTQHALLKPKLIVCNHHATTDISYSHCNRCMKCLFTMLDILAIGEHLSDYGFTLSEETFTSQFQTYLANVKMRRGGTFVACRDTQQHVKQHLETLPQTHRLFFDWLISVDLYSMLEKSSNRPPRLSPFRWEDYKDFASFADPMLP